MACPNEEDSMDGFMQAEVACPNCRFLMTVEVCNGQSWQCNNCKTWFRIILTDFRPAEMVEGEMPTAEITITPTTQEEGNGSQDPVGES